VDGVIIHGIMGSAFRDMYLKQWGEELNDEIRREMEAAEEKALARLAALPLEFGRPVICSSFMDRDHDSCTRFLQDHAIPVLYGPEKAVKAMDFLYQYGRLLNRYST